MKKQSHKIFINLGSLKCLLIFPFCCFAQSPNTQTQPGAGTAALFATPAAYDTKTIINYVRSFDVTRPLTDETAVASGTRTLQEVKQTTQFFDALGKPLQTVTEKISPSGKDLVNAVLYDAIGREVYKYLPYVSTTSDGYFKMSPFTEQQSFMQAMYNPTNDAGGEKYYYGKTDYELSPLNRVVKAYAPGNSWVGDGIGVSVQYLLNTSADSVRIWNIGYTSGSIPTDAGIYAAGQLLKTVSIDESGNNTTEFKDKSGKIILKKAESSASHSTPYNGWSCTYYVYDDLGNLRFVMQPDAVAYLMTHNWAFDGSPANWITSTIAKGFCFGYEYDEEQRMIIKHIPDGGETDMVYDARDRLIMLQDENMRAGTAKKWLITVYDALNRPITTGLLTDDNTRTYHQNLARTSITYPGTTSNFELLTETYFDDYKWIASGAISLSATLITTNTNNTQYFYTPDNATFPYPQAITASYQNKSMVTGTKTKVLGSNPAFYLFSVNFYNKAGRLIQTQSTNYSNPNNVVRDTLTTQYSFSGQVLRTLIAHNKGGNMSQSYRVSTKNIYDAADRLIQVSKIVGNASKVGNEVIITKNSYDELGQLIEKDLGQKVDASNTSSYTYLSTPVDILKYNYNIRGWIRGINKDYARGSGTAWFGMELCYDYGFSSTQVNGNIAGTRWRSKGDGEQRAYGFIYDKLNRLTKADYNQLAGSAWGKTKTDFTTSNLSYDANGNILSMTQMGMVANAIQTLDALAYKCTTNSNTLLYVNDTGSPQSSLGDFRQPASGNGAGTTQDYTYDKNGNLITDNNKGISNIIYNHLNLPSVIQITNKGTITYTYEAGGNKLLKVTDELASASNNNMHTVTTTSYFGSFVYVRTDITQNGTTTTKGPLLQFMNTEEGRVRPATPGKVDTMYYDYFEKDHLGNVRVVLTDQLRKDYYPAATLEGSSTSGGKPNALYTEKHYYTINTANIVVNPAGMPVYQNNNDIYNNNPNSNTTDNSQKVYKLKGSSTAAATGLNVTLKVMSGDVIDILGKSYWATNNTTGGNTNLPLTDIILSLLGTPGGLAASKGATATGLSTGSNPLVLPSAFLTRNPGTGDQKPMAYINYILLDEGFQYVTSGFDRVGNQNAATSHFIQSINVTKNGYLYVYCSNQSPVDVFFDNLQVVQTRSPLIEETHYYPFGLAMSGISSRSLSFGQPDNKTLYNGKELQNKEFTDNSGLELYDYAARMQDLQLGRFTTIDPKCEKFFPASPYSYAVNNPILLLDNDGKDWTITKTVDKNGNVNYNILFTGAVLNSSNNKKINVNALAQTIQKQIETMFSEVLEKNSDGSLKFGIEAHAIITMIDDKKNLLSNQTLFEVKDGTDRDFKLNKPGYNVVASANNGKEIAINANYVNDILSGNNNKTIPHEVGHTGGLRHPIDNYNNYLFRLIHTIGSTKNAPASNFMRQGTVPSPTGPTKEQINRIYRLYQNGNLNKSTGIHPINIF